MAIFNTVYGGEKKVWNWDLTKASESTKVSKTWSTWNWYWYACRWNWDGTKLTVSFSTYKVIQYAVSTAWDINTIWNATYTLSIGNEYPRCIFNDDGTKAILRAYTTNNNNYFTVYSLSTAWDLSTKDSWATYNMGGNYPSPFAISPDGKNLIYQYTWNSKVRYSVSNTAWVLNTSGTEILSWSGIIDGTMSNDGKYFYTMNASSKIIYRYPLTTAWDFSTLSSTADQSVTLTTSASLSWITFDTNWDNMFILCQANNTQYLYKYPLS